MRKFLIASAALAALSATSAQATDWSGAYAGLYGGYADSDVTFGDIGSSEYNGLGANLWGLSTSSDWLAGGTLGFNWQLSPMFVAGLEAEAGWLDLEGVAVQPGSPGGDTSGSVDGGFYMVAAARLGVSFSNWLVYAKGGLAQVDLGARLRDTCTVGPCGAGTLAAEGPNWDDGYALGGGVEVMAWGNWSIKAEYLYLKVEHQTFSGLVNGVFNPNTVLSTEAEINTAKVGLNWHF